MSKATITDKVISWALDGKDYTQSGEFVMMYASHAFKDNGDGTFTISRPKQYVVDGFDNHNNEDKFKPNQ